MRRGREQRGGQTVRAQARPSHVLAVLLSSAAVLGATTLPASAQDKPRSPSGLGAPISPGSTTLTSADDAASSEKTDTANKNVSVVCKSQIGTPGSQSEEVIVEVYLRRTQQLSGGIIAHIQREDMLVPLQEVMILLEFAIQETPQGAAGWFMSEDRRFTLDLAAKQVTSAGKRFTLGPTEARKIEGILYVSARGLSEWLPLDFHANLRALQLHINPRETTPMEERASRNKDKKFGSIHQFRSELPKQETPYALAQVPAFEVDANTGYSSRSGNRVFSSGTVRAFGDVAYMNGEFFATGSTRGITDARLRVGRSDPDGGLLGPLNATQFEVGDVAAVSVPLVSSGISGRGIHVTSRPFAYVAEFDRVTVEGSVANNHEVELYRNNILMASLPPGSSGRYKFDNVPLLRGSNEIRLEFYGPQGQRRTEVKQYFVGDTQVPVGKFNYDVSLNEVGRSVFGFANWVRDNRQFENSAFGGAMRFDYGLARNLSITGGLVAAPLPTKVVQSFGDDYRIYGTLGARTLLGNFAVGLDSAVDDKGGVAGGVSAQTSLDGWNVSARHEQFANHFASDTSLGQASAIRNYAYRTSNSTLRADTFFANLVPGVYFNFGLTGNYTTFEQLAASWRVGTTMGMTAGRFSLSNDIYYGGALVGGNQGIFGSARANLRVFDGINLRVSTDYDLRNSAELQGYTVGLTAPLPYEVTFGLGYAQRFDAYRVNAHNENYFATLRRKFGVAEVGLIASYNKFDLVDQNQVALKDEYRVAMTVSFSTFTDPATLATTVSSDRIARQGAIRPVAFYDTNQNGVRDPGEPLVENARVQHAGGREPMYTGSATKAPSGPVGAGGWTDVALDRSGLPDATMSLGSRGVAVLPRPGVVANVELPVVAKAGVEGRVELNLGNEARVLPNVKVQIVRQAGTGEEKVVAEVNTEFDGVFSLADVPIGDYVVRVEPEQARQIGAKRPIERQITLTPETGVLDGIALKIDRS